MKRVLCLVVAMLLCFSSTAVFASTNLNEQFEWADVEAGTVIVEGATPSAQYNGWTFSSGNLGRMTLVDGSASELTGNALDVSPATVNTGGNNASASYTLENPADGIVTLSFTMRPKSNEPTAHYVKLYDGSSAIVSFGCNYIDNQYSDTLDCLGNVLTIGRWVNMFALYPAANRPNSSGLQRDANKVVAAAPISGTLKKDQTYYVKIVVDFTTGTADAYLESTPITESTTPKVTGMPFIVPEAQKVDKITVGNEAYAKGGLIYDEILITSEAAAPAVSYSIVADSATYTTEADSVDVTAQVVKGDGNATVFAVAYDVEGELIAVGETMVLGNETEAGTTVSYNKPIAVSRPVGKVSVFVWNGFEKIRPMTKSTVCVAQ